MSVALVNRGKNLSFIICQKNLVVSGKKVMGIFGDIIKDTLKKVTDVGSIAKDEINDVGSKINPGNISKGVDYYAYLSSGTFSITFEKPGETYSIGFVSLGAVGAMQQGSFQISESDIGFSEHTGRFQWTAYQNGQKLVNHYAEIAPSTGNLGDSDMNNMMGTPSVIDSDYAMSFGFYDAGSATGLPATNEDQFYVYLTEKYSDWMGDLARVMPSILTKPFGVFALPGAHDSGMFDSSTYKSIVKNPINAETLTSALNQWIPTLGGVLASYSILYIGLITAFTQKDNITTMLDLGIRYFDFRPGYCYKNLAPGIYHQHNFIPGYSYENFLTDILNWLKNHPSEIVVVSLKFDGFANDSMKPSASDLDQIARNTRDSIDTSIQFGDKNSLDTNYGNLIESKQQLIFLNELDLPSDAKPYDSYSDGSYATTNVSTILKSLEDMPKNLPKTYDYTILQLQGTVSNIHSILVSSGMTRSECSSPLLSTKAKFDSITYPWLIANVPNDFKKTKLIVFLNDFADNALVSHSIEVTRQRI